MPTPSEISVNMFRLPLRIEAAPRTKNGHPAHSTTGVASANWTHWRTAGCKIWTPNRSGAIASTRTGIASAVAIHKRRVISISSGLGSSTAEIVRGSSAIPQIGQLPGRSRTISGCIGQVYSVLATGSAGSSAIPHLGHAPGPSCTTSGCIGQR